MVQEQIDPQRKQEIVEEYRSLLEQTHSQSQAQKVICDKYSLDRSTLDAMVRDVGPPKDEPESDEDEDEDEDSA